MTWFADLDPLTYFGQAAAPALRAVGWLDRNTSFPRGHAEAKFYQRLVELLSDPFQPFACAGSHACNVCQFHPERNSSANLFVPADGFLFVCPALITHYINAHEYLPPQAFVDAVLTCPDTRSPEYKRSFLSNGGRLLVSRS